MRELEKIGPTEVDLESYFKANLSQYETPESFQAIAVRLEEKEDPAAVLAKIKSADDFRKLAAKRCRRARIRRRKAGRSSAAKRMRSLATWSRLFVLAEGEWTKQPHVHGKRSVPGAGGEEDAARRRPRLQEVLAAGSGAITWRASNRNWPKRLFADLAQRYDVQILPETAAEAATSRSRKDGKP